jgi:hypothetical protein
VTINKCTELHSNPSQLFSLGSSQELCCILFLLLKLH